ncbi:MAG: hypothetical protein ACRDAX_10085 [Propionibacteriaceae bacterium]
MTTPPQGSNPQGQQPYGSVPTSWDSTTQAQPQWNSNPYTAPQNPYAAQGQTPQVAPNQGWQQPSSQYPQQQWDTPTNPYNQGWTPPPVKKKSKVGRNIFLISLLTGLIATIMLITGSVRMAGDTINEAQSSLGQFSAGKAAISFESGKTIVLVKAKATATATTSTVSCTITGPQGNSIPLETSSVPATSTSNQPIGQFTVTTTGVHNISCSPVDADDMFMAMAIPEPKPIDLGLVMLGGLGMLLSLFGVIIGLITWIVQANKS